jgi:hypothetical protein
MDEKFYDLSDDVIATFNEVYNAKSFPINIGFKFLGASKQKQLIKLSKLNDQYQYLIGKDMLVTINEDVFDKFDEESKRILIEQELDKIWVDANSGKIKTVKPDLVTHSGLVNKYGIEKVARANQVEDLYHQQKADAQLEESDEFIV